MKGWIGFGCWKIECWTEMRLDVCVNAWIGCQGSFCPEKLTMALKRFILLTAIFEL